MLVGSVEEASLSGGPVRDPRIGLFAKTHENREGTSFDFDYFRTGHWSIGGKKK